MSFSKIAVIGGGNIGTQVACLCAEAGYDTILLSSQVTGFRELEIIEDNKITHHGTVLFLSDYYKLADRDLIFVTYPAALFQKLGKMLSKILPAGAYLCVMPGTGGAEFFFKECIDNGVILCGLQRVPSVARLIEYGKSVCVSGIRNNLFLGAIPSTSGKPVADILTHLFGIECLVVPNYLNITLTSSNSLLHTARLSTLFRDYHVNKAYARNPLFYGEWDNCASELLLALDIEHRKILKKLNKIDLHYVTSLVAHYDNSNTASKMTKKLTSISSLHNLASPMYETDRGWKPDFNSRYFSTDFPYGLAIFIAFAKLLKVAVPKMLTIFLWYQHVTGNNNFFTFDNFNISTEEELYSFYLK